MAEASAGATLSIPGLIASQVSAAAHDSNTACYFFKLPTELRLMILDYVFQVHHSIVVASPKDLVMLSNKKECIPKIIFEKFCISRQFLFEALPRLLRLTDFYFQDNVQPKILIKASNSFRQNVTRIHIESEVGAHNVRHLANLSERLNSCPRLKHLTYEVQLSKNLRGKTRYGVDECKSIFNIIVENLKELRGLQTFRLFVGALVFRERGPCMCRSRNCGAYSYGVDLVEQAEAEIRAYAYMPNSAAGALIKDGG